MMNKIDKIKETKLIFIGRGKKITDGVCPWPAQESLASREWNVLVHLRYTISDPLTSVHVRDADL